MRRRLSVHARAAIMLAALGLAAASESAGEPLERIRFCDELLVGLSSAEFVHYEATVSRDGLIDLAEFGEFPASGLTPAQLERSIERALLEEGQTSEANVTVVRHDVPNCSVIDIPQARRPERLEIPAARVDVETKPTIELWPPGPYEVEP